MVFSRGAGQGSVAQDGGGDATGHDQGHAQSAHERDLVAKQQQAEQGAKHNALILKVGHHQGGAAAVGFGHAQLAQSL